MASWFLSTWESLEFPAASQSLNTGTREASVSDAAVHVRRFEALAVSHPLYGKTANQKCYGLGRLRPEHQM